MLPQVACPGGDFWAPSWASQTRGFLGGPSVRFVRRCPVGWTLSSGQHSCRNTGTVLGRAAGTRNTWALQALLFSVVLMEYLLEILTGVAFWLGKAGFEMSGFFGKRQRQSEVCVREGLWRQTGIGRGSMTCDGSVYWQKDWKPWPSKSARLWVVWPQLASVTSGYITPNLSHPSSFQTPIFSCCGNLISCSSLPSSC